MSCTVSNKYMLGLDHPNRSGNKLDEVRALVYHWTANKAEGADDIANARYFGRDFEKDNGRYEEEGTDNEFRYGSAHYIVDQDSIQCVIPTGLHFGEAEEAYHVGAKTYTPYAKSKFMRKNSKGVIVCSPNRLTLGIELCVNKGNDWNKTLELASDLGAEIVAKYNLSGDQIIRHFDVTGKDCPKMFVEDPKKWQDFKALIMKKVAILKGKKDTKPAPTPVVVKTSPVIKYPTLKYGDKGEQVKVLQVKLKSLGYKVTPDGDFGKLTKAIVANFQLANNLTADGIVGQMTWNKIIEQLLKK